MDLAIALAALATFGAAGVSVPDVLAQTAPAVQTWTADNGNGTFSNPLFYDEFSDPDLIRVGNDFYLTGTTMHAMPGLPVLHSTDLVNWEFLSYALDRLDLGPAFRLEDGKESYGRGIWAPSFRYHAGTFHIFSNVNGQTTQHFTAANPRGPWTRTAMKVSLHDLSVLFDDDGKVWVVWGYRDLHLAQLDATLTDTVPGTSRALFGKDALIGEGSHLYKIGGKYYITSAWYAGRMRMPCARADRIEGPWEINPSISADEAFGLRQGRRLRNNGNSANIVVNPANPKARGSMSMHQGGIVETAAGEWWGWSMFEGNSVGRLTALSPVTWKNGWPYFGLPGNLGRSPRIWVKPKTATGAPSVIRAPYVRSDDFSGPALANVWQWNHVPVDSAWSLRERPGYLRLHSLPAPNFWWARNSLTQRAIGPQSTAMTVLDTRGMKPGDVAGLALLDRPYAWIGVRRGDDGSWLEQFDETTGDTARMRVATSRIWLRAECDFLTELARFSYSTDGTHFTPLGLAVGMVFQLKTFQGVRYTLFHYNARVTPGGYADFDRFEVREPHPRALTRPIPVGRAIELQSAGRDTPFALEGQTRFTVVDRGLGRVALRAGGSWLSVSPTSDSTSSVSLRGGAPGDGETFQWIETPYGDLTLMSLATHRYLRLEADGSVTGDGLGAEPDPASPELLRWRVESSSVADTVITERVTVHGESLAGNLEGDSPDRGVIVYLPPSYAKNTTRRFPVLYALHGYSISNEKWTTEIHTPQTIEAAFAAGTPEMIVVLANAQTLHNGSMYSNSATTGNWEDFIARDLVAYVDAHYRTIADRLSRGIAGHSMGGYGTVRIAMRHPDVFSAFYAMSPCCLSARGAPPAERAKQIEAAYRAITQAGDTAALERLDFGARATLASAAAWSPNPKSPPLYLDLPTNDGVPQPNVLARWAANAPLAMVDQYVANLRRYRAIGLDVGDRDGLRIDTEALHQILDGYGIANRFEIYSGDHVSAVADRMQNYVLPFFGRNLVSPTAK